MVSAQISAEQGVGLVVEGHPVVLAGQLVALAAGGCGGICGPCSTLGGTLPAGTFGIFGGYAPPSSNHPSSGGVLSSLEYSRPIRVWPGLL